jgi:predicted NAD/FAD-binding protein
MNGHMEKKRIAIVGSGISGMSALYALRNTQHEVHLFEKEKRLGGHTNTVNWTHNGKSTPVDTGFIVLNTATYRSSIPQHIMHHPITNRNQQTSSNSSKPCVSRL